MQRGTEAEGHSSRTPTASRHGSPLHGAACSRRPSHACKRVAAWLGFLTRLPLGHSPHSHWRPAVYNLDEADVEGQRKRFDLYDEVGAGPYWPPSIEYKLLEVDRVHQPHTLWLAPTCAHSKPDAFPAPRPLLPSLPPPRPPQEARRMLAKRLPVPAYDHLLKLSHTFNLLDARGAVGVTGAPAPAKPLPGTRCACASGACTAGDGAHPLPRCCPPHAVAAHRPPPQSAPTALPPCARWRAR